jgi:porin
MVLKQLAMPSVRSIANRRMARQQSPHDSGNGNTVLREWQARFLGAIVTAAAMLLITASLVRAESAPPQGGNATLPDSSLESQRQVGLGFDDKATGDWWGLRQRLERAGITIDASLVLEGFKNFCGGLNTSRVVGASTFDLSLSVGTEKLFNWQGGEFYVDLEDHAGQNPSTALVGDLQVFDKLNSKPYLEVFELWYQQKLFNSKLRLKIGKVDANTEFSVIDNALEFINSSTQVSPTVFLFPTTPAPMPSVNVFFTPNESCYASSGVYYSNRSEGFGNLVGSPQDVQLSDYGAFLIGETGLRWQHAPLFATGGNLKLGAWGHTGTFTRFDGSLQQGTYGYYAILNQTLWQPAGEPEEGRGVRTFLAYGCTQQTINTIDWHIGGGVAWTGLLSARPNDVAGFSPQYAHISPQAALPRAYELAMEAFYKLQITRWAALMPDLQYIINPGGQYPNALVGTIRLTVNF